MGCCATGVAQTFAQVGRFAYIPTPSTRDSPAKTREPDSHYPYAYKNHRLHLKGETKY